MPKVDAIPPYPRHLTPAERQAVAEKAAHDLTVGYPAAGELAGLMGLLGDIMVQAAWAVQRLDALEAAAEPEGRE